MDLCGHEEGIQSVSRPLMIEKIGADLEKIGIKTTLKSPYLDGDVRESLQHRSGSALSGALPQGIRSPGEQR